MTNFTHAYCAMCEKHDLVMPLHGDRGGPFCCLLCSGKWHAEHGRRRRAGRVVIKTLKGYEAAGGKLFDKDFDRLKLAAGGVTFDNFLQADTAGADFSDLTSELLDAAVALTHPDKHPPERKAEANRVTQELLALKPFVFPAPPPPPPPKPGDVSVKEHSDDLNKPSEPAYPCEDCRDTIHDYYCDPCKAQWKKEQEKKRERKEQKRVEKNTRQRDRYKRLKANRQRRLPPTTCATCGETFKPQRSDARYCSAACRQRAYAKRDGKASNAKPLGRDDIDRTITDVLVSSPDNAFTVDDLCDRVYLGLRRVERKHRMTIIPVAKMVCERLGENWEWWRSEKRGGTLVFLNHASVTSYAMARLKSDWLSGYQSGPSWRRSTEEQLKAEIAPGGRSHEYIVEGGAWWGHCQEAIARFKRNDG